MKLFVWHDPYRVKYGCSMFFAVAEDVDQARRLAELCPAYEFGSDGGRPDRKSILQRDPDRVIEGPCAEWHMWSE